MATCESTQGRDAEEDIQGREQSLLKGKEIGESMMEHECEKEGEVQLQVLRMKMTSRKIQKKGQS